MSAPASTHATRALDRRVQAFDRERVGARHDDEVASVRASTAALMRSTISCCVTISLPGRWPQRLAPTWSSMCIAAAPALISDFTVRATLNARRAEAGVDVDQQRQVADVGDAAHVGQHVVEVVMPRSGRPSEPAATPPPDR